MVAPAFVNASTYATAQTAGVFIEPAALTLELQKGDSSTKTTFTVTNNYSTSIGLHFSFAASSDNVNAGTTDPVKQLSIVPGDSMLPAGGSVTQTVTLRDASGLAPGSQLANLVVSQLLDNSTAVSAKPSVRMPLVLIKDAGAVSGLLASNFGTGGLHMSIPRTVQVTLKNTGNLIAIPHGTIIITDGSGKTVGKGVVNTGSQAVAPGAKLTLNTPVITLAAASLLGNYRTTLSYGLGGDQPSKQVSTRFFFVRIPHIIAIITASLLILVAVKVGLLLLRPRPPLATLKGGSA